MYLTIVGLALSPDITDRHLDAQLLVDALWTVAAAADRVEHISARSGTRQVDVGIYVLADSQAGADRAAHKLLHHAVLTIPLLRGWAIRPPPPAATGLPAQGA